MAAFRDKIERIHGKDKNKNKDFYYKVYGKKIVERYRKAALAKFGENFFSAENNYGSPHPAGARQDYVLVL